MNLNNFMLDINCNFLELNNISMNKQKFSFFERQIFQTNKYDRLLRKQNQAMRKKPNVLNQIQITCEINFSRKWKISNNLNVSYWSTLTHLSIYSRFPLAEVLVWGNHVFKSFIFSRQSSIKLKKMRLELTLQCHFLHFVSHISKKAWCFYGQVYQEKNATSLTNTKPI